MKTTHVYGPVAAMLGMATFASGQVMSASPAGSGGVVVVANTSGAGIPGTNVASSASNPLMNVAPATTTAPALSGLQNTSARVTIEPGGSATFGFVLSGDTHVVLIRAIGPGLAGFNIATGLAHPTLTLIKNGQVVGANTAGWTSWDVTANPASPTANALLGTGVPLAQTFAQAGTFPLTTGSADAAISGQLTPGVYSVSVASANPAETGEVLFELYIIQ